MSPAGIASLPCQYPDLFLLVSIKFMDCYAFQAHLRFPERSCGSRQNPRRKQTVSWQALNHQNRHRNRRTMLRALEDALRRHSSGGAPGSGGFPGKGQTLAGGNSTAGAGGSGGGVDGVFAAFERG